MKLRKNIRKYSLRLLLIILISYLAFIYTIYYSFKSIGRETNTKFISFLLNENNPDNLDDYIIPKVINNLYIGNVT